MLGHWWGSRAFRVAVVLFSFVFSQHNSAQAQGAEPLRVVLPHRVLFDISLPFYVAQQKGFFDKVGLQVKPIFARGGGDQVQIMVAGDADLAIGVGLLATLSALEKGAPLKIVSAEAKGLGDIFWYVKGDSAIKRIEDLAGRKIGFSNPGASSHMATLVLAEWFKSKKLKEPEPTAVGSPPEQFTAVMTGQIDAGWSTPPFFFEEIEKKNIRMLFGGNEIPGLSEITLRVNVARSELLKARPQALREYLRAIQEATKFIFGQQEEAAKIWIANAKLKESLSTVKEAWKFYTPESMALAPIVGIERSLADAVKFKFVKKPFTREDFDRATDLSLVPKP
ncbi:MAG TPA: ABC transporter substrate-binding protein [Candidatus Acidoferrales bacterium]|nr:ABC transporter substrate-binding protein [Candidatus Acidoferrales bacterium]